jgi:uncharacterized protein with GYD domain
MATFISFLSWTEQGIRNFRDTLDRATAFEKLCEQRGASLKDIYYCLGEHDIVGIVEAPDDETATALLLELGSLGNVRTRTVRAFNRDEMADIIARTSS